MLNDALQTLPNMIFCTDSTQW